MTKKILLVASGFFTSLLVSAPQEPSASRYKTFSDSAVKKCSIRAIHEPTFNICLEGQATGPDLERAHLWSARASLTWLRALKVIDERVTRSVKFTCENRHLTIRLRPGKGTSYASPSVTTIYLTRPYGTWSHELGHALAGLGDTYNGGAGSCGSHPDSLMCWGAYGPRANPEEWSTLWPDDIKGIQANFRKVFSGDSFSPSWSESIDLEESLDLNDPWPETEREEIFFEGHQVEVIRGPASEIDYSRSSESIDL